MASIRFATASNIQAFQKLSNELTTSNGKWSDSIDHEALEDEFGRFRVWSGNLGALQKGHSSLDYRLRDSPLLSDNALKFLKELEENLNAAYEIVSGARLPYEEQPHPDEDDDEEEDDDDGFFSEDEEDDDPDETRTELGMRFGEVVDIIDNLYKLSVRIRTPTLRSRSLKAASYQPTDPETGVDLLAMYAEYDLQHTKELLWHLRQPHVGDTQLEHDFLVTRLSKGITLRRRQFKYWKRHRDKLSVSTVFEEELPIVQPVINRPNAPQRMDTLEVQSGNPIFMTKEAPSHKTGKTLLSGTEATQHYQSLDEIVDTKSVTSYAVTVKDIQGRGVDLPPPPKCAEGDKDFECPYCFVICPARYGRGRAWRTHLLQDLQPYVCTYPDCESTGLFRSRREWEAHEAGHRKAWRCSEHPTAVYKTPAGLEDHLRQKHLDSFPESQLNTIVKVGETSTIDIRAKCPICYVPADTEGLGNFQNHIAHHLERIATFALPIGNENAADGASSAASRGRSGRSGRSDSTGSQNVMDMSLPSDTSDELEERKKVNSQHRQNTRTDAKAQQGDPDPTLAEITSSSALSLESLRRLPDGSQNRIEALLLDHTSKQDSFDDQNFDQTSVEVQEHLEQREKFRTYLMSLPGIKTVRFFRGYGMWAGQAIFKDGDTAAKALKMFNGEQFPQIKIHQVFENSNKLRFGIPNLDQSHPTRQSTMETQDSQDIASVTSVSISYDGETEQSNKRPVISVADIPTLRSLYRSRKLLQRDQSYAPNDAYNRIISFCYYDVTRLKVDAIVNSANRVMNVTKNSVTLNNIIHKAAGPELTKEAKAKGKVKPGQSILTGGYNLPSAHIIHTSRPHYSGSKGMGQFNILNECYRSAMNVAKQHGFKTIAFPCVGTGGCGFPHRVAARVALQEVRELLDSQTNHGFERIIFCVHNAIDEKAYMDFLPVFFPPTHADLDIARKSNWSANRAALAVQVLETRTEIQAVIRDLSNTFSLVVPGFDQAVLSEFGAIDLALTSVREFLLGIQELKRSLGDLSLFCSVMSTLCGSITEITEKSEDDINARDYTQLWSDYNSQMTEVHGMNLVQFLTKCRRFIQCLDDILTSNGIELDEIAITRLMIETYAAKQKHQSSEGIRDYLDGILYVREHQRDELPQTRGIVMVNQIPSVSQLYQLNELEEKATLAHPSAIFNHTVYLAREDITKVQVDIMVNSTDKMFAGMGTLDRSVFKKGGPKLQEDCKNFGVCKEGDVKVTAGYLLPAKQILHVIPPERYRKDTRDVLRKIYREVLHMSVTLRAKSIAIPSIGTGALNYPRRDTASLAMEEVKLFLESAMPNSLIENIIFVVYSSNDEFIYKSLLPVYFPPTDKSLQAQPSLRPMEPNQSSIAREPSPVPRRTLFGSIGEAFRNVRFGSPGKQPAADTKRSIDANEEHILIEFESHARDCTTCKDIDQLYSEGQILCEVGYPLAQALLYYMDMSVDQNVYAKSDKAKLEIPADMFPLSLLLLATIKKSVQERPSNELLARLGSSELGSTEDYTQEGTIPTGVTIHHTDVQIPIARSPEKAWAHVDTWSNLAKRWEPLYPGQCSIHVYSDRIDIRESDTPKKDQIPLLSLKLTPSTTVKKHASKPELTLVGTPRLRSVLKIHGDILLRSENAATTEELLQILNRALEYNSESLKEKPHSKAIGGKPEESEAWPKGSNERANDRSQQDQDLLNVRHESDFLKGQEERQLSALQSKVQTLSEATSKLRSSPLAHEQESATSDPTKNTKTPEPSNIEILSPLALEILSHLTTDLKSRPGSYIGQNIKDIASVLLKSTAEISAAMEDLAAQGYVHNTLDGNTWVISHHPNELPALVERPKKVAASETTTTQLREVTRFHDTPPSPTSYHPSTSKQAIDMNSPELDLNTINIDDYFTYPSPSGVRWTRIDKYLVDAQVLTDADEAFDNTEDGLIVHRVLRRGEIRNWAKQTRELRKREEESEGREEKKRKLSSVGMKGTRDEREEERDARRRESEDVPAKEKPWQEFRTDKRNTRGDEDRGVRRRSTEKDKDKDKEQEQLDRLLAGDVKEAELLRAKEEERSQSEVWGSRRL